MKTSDVWIVITVIQSIFTHNWFTYCDINFKLSNSWNWTKRKYLDDFFLHEWHVKKFEFYRILYIFFILLQPKMTKQCQNAYTLESTQTSIHKPKHMKMAKRRIKWKYWRKKNPKHTWNDAWNSEQKRGERKKTHRKSTERRKRNASISDVLVQPSKYSIFCFCLFYIFFDNAVCFIVQMQIAFFSL